eukprot:6491392-Amphidinium_carterae.1
MGVRCTGPSVTTKELLCMVGSSLSVSSFSAKRLKTGHELSSDVSRMNVVIVGGLACGTVAVWDLAILHEDGFALTPDQTVQAELTAWSQLWQPGTPQENISVVMEYRRLDQY